MRSGHETKVHYDDIMVGDLIKIKAGMNVPVDGIVVHAKGVSCNEAAMTGESDELKKENMEQCRHRQDEKNAELNFQKDPKRNHHDLPSPLILSGT